MSRRWLAAIFVVLISLVAAGLIITYIQKARMNAHLAASQNNLRQLALFAAHDSNRDPSLDPAEIPKEVPAGTVPLAGQPPDNRLSWFVYVLPGLDQRRQDITGLVTQINDHAPWSDARNQEAARVRLLTALCPLNTPQTAPDQPAVTSYVGIAGVGADAASLPLSPLPQRAPPKAGAFRYDSATPFDRIGDGLSQTLLMGETAENLGPWLRGGLSTVRGIDNARDARPLIGREGQFGGYFPNGANFALCDGSVRIITPRISPEVFLRMATIDEGAGMIVPD
jgi:prepilin-type processing-associated H-X9-DG protein